MDHDAFVKEALANYSALPEETNLLYKRHHIPVPHLFSFNGTKEQGVEEYLKEHANALGIAFDLAVGSESHLLSSGRNIRVTSPSDDTQAIGTMMHKSSEDKYLALIDAHSRRFIHIEVPKGTSAELKILFVNGDSPLTSHVLINIGEAASLKLLELYTSSSARRSMSGVAHEINAAPGSKAEIDMLHNENANTTVMAFIRNRAGADSKIDINVFYNGGELTRARGTVDATGARSEVRVNEIVFGCSSQRFDINTMILNSGRESNASLESRAVLMDSSFCLLKGYAKVNRGASGSKSYVHERGILLDRGARIDGLPDMSVEESAVKATHSSATSPIDPEAVFYLMSKSIDELGVRRLIVSGFLAESVARMHNQFARDTSMALLDRKLEKKEFGLIPKAGEASWSFGEEGKKDMFLGHYKYR